MTTKRFIPILRSSEIIEFLFLVSKASLLLCQIVELKVWTHCIVHIHVRKLKSAPIPVVYETITCTANTLTISRVVRAVIV